MESRPCGECAREFPTQAKDQNAGGGRLVPALALFDCLLRLLAETQAARTAPAERTARGLARRPEGPAEGSAGSTRSAAHGSASCGDRAAHGIAGAARRIA